jgi:hypothetical protein
MRISAIVTNYNTWSSTLDVVAALNRCGPGPLAEIIVVDDASDAPPPGQLSGAPLVRIIRNPQNRGYVRSLNIGAREAVGDILLVLDSDAVPITDVVGPLPAAFERRPRLGALGLRAVDRNGAVTGSSQPVPSLLGFVLGQRLEARLESWKPWPARPTVYYSCALAVRAEAFKAIGGMDEEFDFLDADVDFGWRLHESRWEQALAPELVVRHEGGGSPQATARRVIRFHRNRWQLLSKHGVIRNRLPVVGALMLRHLGELAMLLAAGGLIDSTRFRDKIDARRALLSTVSRGYVDAYDVWTRRADRKPR